MTDKPMTHLERIALQDLKAWRGVYVWKQASMQKLEARGFVVADGKVAGLTVWKLTDAGREAANV